MFLLSSLILYKNCILFSQNKNLYIKIYFLNNLNEFIYHLQIIYKNHHYSPSHNLGDKEQKLERLFALILVHVFPIFCII